MSAHIYEVRVKSPIPADVLLELGATRVVEEPAHTILTTQPIDQAGLQAILERVRQLGLELLEIRKSPEPENSPKQAST